jgi:hypothetical protein
MKLNGFPINRDALEEDELAEDITETRSKKKRKSKLDRKRRDLFDEYGNEISKEEEEEEASDSDFSPVLMNSEYRDLLKEVVSMIER